MKLIDKFLKLKKVKLVFVTGKKSEEISHLVFNLINPFYKVALIDEILTGFQKISFLKSDVVVLSDDDFSLKELETLFSSMEETFLIVNSKNLTREKKLTGFLDEKGQLLVDHESLKKIPGKKVKQRLSYGTDSEADLSISDLNISEKINFKINYKGSTVPVWIEGKEDKIILNAAALGVGAMLGINFVDLTRSLSI